MPCRPVQCRAHAQCRAAGGCGVHGVGATALVRVWWCDATLLTVGPCCFPPWCPPTRARAVYLISPPKLGGGAEGDYDDEHTECLLTFIAQMDPRGWVWRRFGFQHEVRRTARHG